MGTTSFTLYIDSKDAESNDIRISGAKDAEYTVRKLSGASDSAYAIDVALSEAVNSPIEGLLYTIRINSSSVYYFKLSFADYAFSVYSFGNSDGNADLVLLDETTTQFSVSSDPDDDLSFSWRIADETVAQIGEQSGKYCFISAIASGKPNCISIGKRLKTAR